MRGKYCVILIGHKAKSLRTTVVLYTVVAIASNIYAKDMKYEQKDTLYKNKHQFQTKAINTTNNFFVCMKMPFLSVIHDLRRFEETDRKEESLRFG